MVSRLRVVVVVKVVVVSGGGGGDIIVIVFGCVRDLRWGDLSPDIWF